MRRSFETMAGYQRTAPGGSGRVETIVAMSASGHFSDLCVMSASALLLGAKRTLLSMPVEQLRDPLRRSREPGMRPDDPGLGVVPEQDQQRFHCRHYLRHAFGNECHRPAPVRTLMLSTAGHVNFRVSDKACQRAADKGARVTG